MVYLKEGQPPFRLVEQNMIPEELLSLMGDPNQVVHALSGKQKLRSGRASLPKFIEDEVQSNIRDLRKWRDDSRKDNLVLK
ncbi:MAG: hypothetical protein COX79_03665 [Candidatus Levybacteria bacterium CG_4_10_14_0_2_um_filter_36_16]|nr:MAG: hypothetical protein AUK12_03415 [Candidatus Levybacteria bacterium CG2_30_37_29]PIR78864.1 MAG: hypothetical protein COU26_04300 [Candidatus Levybacteria bacterium CG10_big_fil_rev_8_21_14_0_10_36_30]PIZ97058.1 MAG: hypothetical protein COX79_03665 [Candidatus Levybacteria bacterium CG_4_10_14_0_2_um_filter_36_16]